MAIALIDKWVKVRVTMVSGAAVHVMPEGMFPLVRLERKPHQIKLWQQLVNTSEL